MKIPWTIHDVASELVDVLPQLGRIMYQHRQTIHVEKATLMQVGALLFLVERPMTVSMLAKKRGVSLQAASVLVQGLVERGWVSRIPDPDDRRQSLLEVTPEGLARAHLAKDAISSYLCGHLDGLEPEEIAAARTFLPALRRVLMQHLITDTEDIPDEMCFDLPDE